MWRSKKAKNDEVGNEKITAENKEEEEADPTTTPPNRFSKFKLWGSKASNKSGDNNANELEANDEEVEKKVGENLRRRDRLWNTTQQFVKGEKEEEEEDDKTNENNESSEPAQTQKGDNENLEKASIRSRWTSLWDHKSCQSKVDCSNNDNVPADVEVEIETQMGTLKIHDPTGQISSQSLPLSYAPSNDRPSIYDEALEMLTAALLIYIFAALREMAREGVIDSQGLLQEPIGVQTVVDAIQRNKEKLEERAIKHEEIGEKLMALKSIHEQQQNAQEDPKAPTHIQQVLQGGTVASAAGLAQSKESALVKFQDEKTTQGVVYGIALNHLRKRITVVFRGSVTQQDFIIDTKSHLKKIDNPVTTLDPGYKHKHIKIHTGFHSYLFREDKDGKQRLRHILDDVKELMKEHANYRLYCTGHSLGGACCTLFGFYAAMEDELVQNGPVVVISIASPRVGGYEFCDSFHELEQKRRIQHLRVSNKEDVVTHLPFIALKATAMSPLLSAILGAGNLYKHCGINLEMKSLKELKDEHEEGDAGETTMIPDKHYQLCYPQGRMLERKNSSSFYSKDFESALEAAKALAESLVPVRKADFEQVTEYHSCREYEERLIAAEDYFSTVTLDQLYVDTSIVGDSLTRGPS